MIRRILLGLGLLGLVLLAGFAALAWHPALDPIAPPARASFPGDLVARGAELASIGYCSSCHTPAGGAPFSGGRPLPTPFGTIYGTNITPDQETGIGAWSEAAFSRAMREGVDREGHNLYPAFPYDHFTRLTDYDIRALYAFMMTRAPVRAETPANALSFPYNMRPLLAGWNLLFLRKGVVQPDPSRSPAWNQGAYLSEALAHCGGCHTPRNRLGAEVADRHFDGGEAEDWWAPPLNATSPAPAPWTEASLFAYLRSWDAEHGSGVGPMAPVSSNLSQVPEADVQAIATYVASLMGPPSAERRKATEAIIARSPPGAAATASGAAIYAGTCAVCHESGGQVPFTARSLALHTTMVSPDPRNVIHVILEGIHPREGTVGAIMPAFAGTLTDRQVTDLTNYLRARFTNEPPWDKVEDHVRRISAAHGPS